MINLQYDVAVAVTRTQYLRIRSRYGQMCATRHDRATGKFYIKLWIMAYKEEVEAIINNKPYRAGV